MSTWVRYTGAIDQAPAAVHNATFVFPSAMPDGTYWLAVKAVDLVGHASFVCSALRIETPGPTFLGTWS